ncbi:hypothetical protein EML15_00425 [Corynebacterium sp. sy017]|uniref:hypothetical protein n=1 Tax=unclassified Corynebacterium TaxID=2624378 RepID=UPI001186B933|nr:MULTISPECIES: hypothetical protein [unclassified Corynebacterium]MBP3087620.1 hypothetical protein [Corynebacterium sp. sy017]QDZ42614.1 hypothetical protein FQV43_05155 [Corynebacterium sp. sy039]TSD92187.1 hypothetical protein ELY17_00425 [Corynebacterium sp. SY003]
MSPLLSDTFQPRIDEFIEFLSDFGSGTYVRDAEVPTWSQPFDVSALPELKALIERYVLSLDHHCETDESLTQHISEFYQQLMLFNERRCPEAPIVEDEEIADLEVIIHDALRHLGVSSERISAIPSWEDLAMRHDSFDEVDGED